MSEGNLRPISRAHSIVRSVCPHRSSSSLSTSIYFIVFIHYNYIIRIDKRTWWKSGKRFRSKLPCFDHAEVEGTWQRKQWPLFPLPCTLDLRMVKTRKFRSKPLSALPPCPLVNPYYVVVMNEYNKINTRREG